MLYTWLNSIVTIGLKCFNQKGALFVVSSKMWFAALARRRKVTRMWRTRYAVLLSFLLLRLLSSYLSGADKPDALRQAFLKVIDRPRVPLAPSAERLPEREGLVQWHFTFAADASQRVTGLLVKQSSLKTQQPVLIVLHGTGGNKEGQTPLLKELAMKGFTAVAIDGRYHGERVTKGARSAEYVNAILRTWRTGEEHPFLYDTVWDLMRLIDYLETREDVDRDRIGMIGFSKGGMETYLAAAVDPRIAVAVPCIGVQSFRWALENGAWKSRVETFQAAIDTAAKEAGLAEITPDFVRQFYDRVAPGIYGQFDGPEMLPLIAPRPLLSINGDSDPRTPRPGVMECAEAARKAYAAKNAPERFALHLQENTGHKVTAPALQLAISWFEKWLNSSPSSSKKHHSD